jgi:hypothetical protein
MESAFFNTSEWEIRAREILDWLDANPGLARGLAAKGIAIELRKAFREGVVAKVDEAEAA